MSEATRELILAILAANVLIALPFTVLVVLMARRLERILQGIQDDTHRLAAQVKGMDREVEKLTFRTDGLLVAHRMGS